MQCIENRFCRSLEPKVRDVLCENCKKRTYKKGQIIYRSDISSVITLIVEGASYSLADYSEDVLDDGDCPAFFINTQGLILGGDMLFNTDPIDRYEFIGYMCLNDCVIARFSRDIIRQLFKDEHTFAVAMYQNIMVAAGEACEFAALLRASNVERSVRYLLSYAYRKGISLTHQQMADITGHSRVSITRALASVRKNYPSEWERYKNRAEEM